MKDWKQVGGEQFYKVIVHARRGEANENDINGKEICHVYIIISDDVGNGYIRLIMTFASRNSFLDSLARFCLSDWVADQIGTILESVWYRTSCLSCQGLA